MRSARLSRSALFICSIAVSLQSIAGPGTQPATKPALEAKRTISFCGNTASGNRIVFVCDATGSVMQRFDLLRAELRKVVASLGPEQSFDLIFFQENARPPFGANGPVPASEENKRLAFDYIDTYQARGPTDPMPALQLAAAMNPDVIYFLAQPSCFPDKEQTLQLFRAAKTTNKALRIHTIAFVDHDFSGEKFLKQAAEEGGGGFKYVSEDDLSSPAKPSP